jgi:hypothetical protein
MEPFQSEGMSHATMYGDRYSVTGKCLHPLAIKARGKKQPRRKKKEENRGGRVHKEK